MLKREFMTDECVHGAIFTNRNLFVEQNERADKDSSSAIRTSQANELQFKQFEALARKQGSRHEAHKFNLRGIKTFNLLKKVVYACVLENRGESKNIVKESTVDLKLLKGLISEIHMEIKLTDHKMLLNGEKDVENGLDICCFDDYLDFRRNDDHPDICRLVKQLALIEPHRIYNILNQKSKGGQK